MESQYENRTVQFINLEKIINRSPGVIFCWSMYKNWPVLFVTQNITEQFGYLDSEFVDGNLKYEDIIYKEDIGKVKYEIRDYIKKGIDKFSIQHRIVKKNGDVVWIENNAWFVRDENGNIICLEGIIMNIDKRKKIEEEITYLGHHDKLTGTYNRTYFEDLIYSFNEKKVPIGIMFLDVNGLKLVNDAFGHKKGDDLLIRITQIIKNSLDKKFIICRIGGDEFSILKFNTCADEMIKCIKDIKDNCNKSFGEPIKPSIAIGHTIIYNVEEDVEKKLIEAERKMYETKLLESKRLKKNVIVNLKNSLEDKSYESNEHCSRLEELAVRYSKKCGLSEEQTDKLIALAYYHDIGKVAIPEHIFQKKDELTKDEWKNIKRHCEIGYNITKSIPELAPISEYILYHHERWDGKGYPQGLKGEEIPLLSRIIFVMDAYDVMTNNSLYKEQIDKKEAMQELVNGSGTQFDPVVVSNFIKILK